MEVLTILALFIAVFLGFFVQTIVGFAASLVAFPILLIVFNLQEATAIMGILYVIFSTTLVIKNWADINKKVVAEVSIGIIFGMIIGVYLLRYGSPIILKKMLGLFIILYVGYINIKKKKIQVLKKIGLLLGFLSGIFGGLFSAGGPLLVTYIHNKIDKDKIIRATVIGCLSIINYVRIPLLFHVGLYTYDLLKASLIALPSFFLALYVGHKLYGKIDEKSFKKIFMIILLISGISLLFR